MTFDEFYFHERRRLQRWESWGHPLDTLTVIAPTLYLFVTTLETVDLTLYLPMAIFSSLFVTKDEWIHKEQSPAKEQWLHSILFMLHPIVFWSLWQLHQIQEFKWIAAFLVLQILFFLYQVVRWNVLNTKK
jgi:hypothetical protein